MFTHKDIETRSIFVINCLERTRAMRVQTGGLLLEEIDGEKKRTLTKFPFQKLLAIFVIGHITVTTPMIDNCRKYGVALIVLKPNLRPVFYWSDAAEANYLLRKRQYEYGKNDLSIAKVLVTNKILNQQTLLQKTRLKDDLTLQALEICSASLNSIDSITDYNKLMGLEGMVAKQFFAAYFQKQEWKGRQPRMKRDIMNVTLDIGYTILFNFIECFLRLYGFDLYIGVYHRLWYKRKSLVCDLVEPFRSIIDHTVLIAFNRKQFTKGDFTLIKKEYHLKYEKCGDYYNVFYDALIDNKLPIFKYIQQYYRCFMGRKTAKLYPLYEYK